MIPINRAGHFLLPLTAVVIAAMWVGGDHIVLAQAQPPLADSAGAPVSPPLPTPSTDSSAGVALELEGQASEDLGYSVLLKGPVHEAFATPTDDDLSDGVRVYSEPPPQPIQEQPPKGDSKANGLTWVPGYWAWSDETSKYVWVSGLYRKVPQGRSWVPGYWSASGSGYRWTSGYWALADGSVVQRSAEKIQYLPPPPNSIDNGPSVAPPGENYFWLPGQWEYTDSGYQWRSGFWTQQHTGWVWQPASYLYTPQGCVYVPGYWDVLPDQRGQLYAPIVFDSPIYQQPGYVYQPRYPLAQSAALLTYLFFRPGHSHYYYGDYYDRSHASLGYRPWYDTGFGDRSSSPWIGYYDWKYRRSGIDFVGSMKRYDQHYRSGTGHQPTPSVHRDRHTVGRAPISAGLPQGSDELSGRSFDEIVRRDVGGKQAKRLDTSSSPDAARRSKGSATAFPTTRPDSSTHPQWSSRGKGKGPDAIARPQIQANMTQPEPTTRRSSKSFEPSTRSRPASGAESISPSPRSSYSPGRSVSPSAGRSVSPSAGRSHSSSGFSSGGKSGFSSRGESGGKSGFSSRGESGGKSGFSSRGESGGRSGFSSRGESGGKSSSSHSKGKGGKK